MLHGAWSNLISNAVKFTPAKGSIKVRLSKTDDHAIVTISDTGIGMTADEMEHAFDRFYRSTEALNQEGSGLGLTITKAIIEKHAGTICFSSTFGKGTTATVRLPLNGR